MIVQCWWCHNKVSFIAVFHMKCCVLFVTTTTNGSRKHSAFSIFRTVSITLSTPNKKKLRVPHNNMNTISNKLPPPGNNPCTTCAASKPHSGVETSKNELNSHKARAITGSRPHNSPSPTPGPYSEGNPSRNTPHRGGGGGSTTTTLYSEDCASKNMPGMHREYTILYMRS